MINIALTSMGIGDQRIQSPHTVIRTDQNLDMNKRIFWRDQDSMIKEISESVLDNQDVEQKTDVKVKNIDFSEMI